MVKCGEYGLNSDPKCDCKFHHLRYTKQLTTAQRALTFSNTCAMVCMFQFYVTPLFHGLRESLLPSLPPITESESFFNTACNIDFQVGGRKVREETRRQEMRIAHGYSQCWIQNAWHVLRYTLAVMMYG